MNNRAMSNTSTQYITVHLGKDAHNTAHNFAVQQNTVEKGEQVYLNTLAVYALHNYLRILEIDTDFEQSYSWNPFFRTFQDVSDLFLPNVGRIICRPVLPSETAFTVADEVEDDPIGYIAVQFGELLDTVQLIGFIPTNSSTSLPKQVSIENLGSLENLIDCIYDHTSSEDVDNLSIECLRQWLEGQYGEGWRLPQEVLTTKRRGGSGSPSNEISRAKTILLGEHIVVLLVSVQAITEDLTDVLFRLYPGDRETTLPIGLQLRVIDNEDGEILAEAETEAGMNFIELDLAGVEPGYRFVVQLFLSGNIKIERFEG